MTTLPKRACTGALLLVLAHAVDGQVPVAKSTIPKALNNELQTLMVPGSTIKDCPDCPELVVLPGGSFAMGSSADAPRPNGGQANETPQHKVDVPAFAMGKFEVTQEQWTAVMGDNRSFFKGRNLPVENITWHEAQTFVRRLTQITRKNYRLPSESEWEYAARAGTVGEWGFANPLALGDYAWYHAVSDGRTHPVGLKLPNAFGLFDMHGNVWEWVEDCYHDHYGGAPADGSAWSQACGVHYGVIRGGSFDLVPQLVRSAVRYWIYPERRAYYIGFRVARDL